MNKIAYLLQQAARAERLAKTTMDNLTVERLQTFAVECRTQAKALDATGLSFKVGIIGPVVARATAREYARNRFGRNSLGMNVFSPNLNVVHLVRLSMRRIHWRRTYCPSCHGCRRGPTDCSTI
jgi:hypothetical protein